MKRTSIVAGICALFTSFVTAAWAQDLPRYKLSVGQHLKYESVGDSKYQSGRFHNEAQWDVFVAGKNDDGSVRLILQQKSKFSQIMDGQPRGSENESNELAYVDLFPDGHFARNDSLGFRVEPAMVFPMLPQDAQGAKKGWKQESAFATLVYSQPKNEGEVFGFHLEQQSEEATIYLVTNSSEIQFDTKRGLVSQIDGRNSQGYGFQSKGESKTTLKSLEQEDAQSLEQLRRESQVYFDAKHEYMEKVRQTDSSPNEAAKLMNEGEQILKIAREKVTLPLVSKLLDDDLSNHKRYLQSSLESARLLAENLNKPAADWTLMDVDGKTHSLADYRGKVVLLDFWYRGCGWCIRAMPQIKQVVVEFKDKPVVVLGMNTDRDVNDAKFVIEKLGLNYQTLRADQDLPQKYGVRGFPTLIIIDPKGVVRDIHVGYSPDLKEQVEKSVKRILPERTADAGR
jgi:thiol-disulfide isomerase/thioredoxin